MLNIDTALAEKMDKVIETMCELKTQGQSISDDELDSLLSQTYHKILPPIAKVFVKEDKFKLACLKKKAYIINNVDKLERRSRLRIV